MATASAALQDFLEPFHVDKDKIWELSESFTETFERLSAESSTQFLGTPISDSILRSVSSQGSGRYCTWHSRPNDASTRDGLR